MLFVTSVQTPLWNCYGMLRFLKTTKFIAVDFKIPYNSSHTKAQLRSHVLETLIKQGLLPDFVLDYDASNDSDCEFISDLGATAQEPTERNVNVGECLDNCD